MMHPIVSAAHSKKPSNLEGLLGFVEKNGPGGKIEFDRRYFR
ncbi:hypothetical protein [Archangium violaceum]|nr:hypothetical protein [Archangium violaceum]